MRRTALSGVVMLALLIPAVPASAKLARHSTPPNCSTVHSQLVAADTQAQVFKALNSFPLPAIYGCVYGSRHTYELGEVRRCGGAAAGGICGGITNVVLDGSIVAYEGLGSEPAEPERKSARPLVIVRDLRTGQILRRLPSDVLGPSRVGSVMAIVVKSNGAVAWIVEDRESTPSHPAEYEVHAVDGNGSRVLAASSEIDPSSLALVGSTLYWMQAGNPASAPLN